jgi:signal transduction histidine kinase
MFGNLLRIAATAGAGCAIVTVADEGGGIAPEHLPRIFEPFYTTKGEGGTGLGLALARELMVRLGGSITAANRAGGGALFTLQFPTAE